MVVLLFEDDVSVHENENPSISVLDDSELCEFLICDHPSYGYGQALLSARLLRKF